MNTHSSIRHLGAPALMSLVFPLLLPLASAGESGKHLFILSGQSNMTGGLVSGFTLSVEATFGKENVTVVSFSKPGRGIRFWDKDYRFPDGYRFPGKAAAPDPHDKQHGEVYEPMLHKILGAIEGKSYDTTTLIWMQGESDAGRGLGEVYEASFLRLLTRLQADLKLEELSFVIGRVSDTHWGDPGWLKMREVQVKIAEAHANGAWIDTDDLNGGEEGKPGGDLHYPKDQAPVLGERFALRAMDLIRIKSGAKLSDSRPSAPADPAQKAHKK